MQARIVLPILTTSLLAISVSIASAQRTASPRVIRCEGPFGRNASHDDLVKAFGVANVIYQDVVGAEGEKIKASVLYPTERKARLEIIWSDEKARRGPMIRVKDQSAWASPNGIHIGMALAEVENLNGKPFKLSGFDWDYGGRALDWQGGALAKPQPGGCIVGVSFVHIEDAPEANLTRVTGDNEFSSDSADMRAVEPYASEVTISYPQR
jgi:hypothetical protein